MAKENINQNKKSRIRETPNLSTDADRRTNTERNIQEYSAVQCCALQFSAVHNSAVQCSAVQCSALHCSAAQCNPVWDPTF